MKTVPIVAAVSNSNTGNSTISTASNLYILIMISDLVALRSNSWINMKAVGMLRIRLCRWRGDGMERDVEEMVWQWKGGVEEMEERVFPFLISPKSTTIHVHIQQCCSLFKDLGSGTVFLLNCEHWTLHWSDWTCSETNRQCWASYFKK